MLPADGVATHGNAAAPADENGLNHISRSMTGGRLHAHRVRRILITADAVGGVWPYVLDLATALRRHAVQVTVAVMGPPPTDRQRVAAAACGVSLVEEAFRLEWMEDPWDDLERAGEWLLALEGRAQPDVVHLNGFRHATLPWRAPVLVAGHSCVRSWWRAVHGSEAPATWDRYSQAVARGLAAARVVVAPTSAMLDALDLEYGGLRDARVIRNGRLAAGRWNDTVSKQPIVFSAGRVWDPAKNIEALCAAAERLPWPVYVAGETRAPEGECAPYGQVEYLGRLEGAELEQWFARAAIYALPARYEPFGLSVLEAAIAGCALVLGDIASLRENWSGAAIFVPPEDTDALVAAIRRLIDDADERTRLADGARARARRFTVERMAGEYLRVYQELLDSHPAPGPESGIEDRR